MRNRTMTNSKTSLGIEIAAGQISFALLSQSKGKVKLVKTGQVEVAEGLIVDGNITDPHKVGKSVRRLLSKNGVRISQAFVSLTASPCLTQIISLPHEVPSNLREFVQSEIRHSAALSGKGHQLDYCGLGSGLDGMDTRVIVTAVDDSKLAPLLKTLDVARIEPLSIEPNVIGWIRALYADHVAGNYDGNVLFAKLDKSKMTVCVFRKSSLDFIRNCDLPFNADDAECSDVFCQEVNSVKQYYDVEVASFEDEKWNMVVDTYPGFGEIESVSDFLHSEFGSVHICSTEDPTANTSISAVGLALNGIGTSKFNVKLDIVPDQIREKKAVRRLAFAALSVAAVFMIIIAMSSSMLSLKNSATDQMVAETKKDLKLERISELIAEQKLVEDQMNNTENDRQFMVDVFSQETFRDWAGILNVLVEKSPSDLCIMTLRQIGDDTLVISGKVTGYRSAHDFARLIEETGLFKSVVVSKMNKDNNYKGLVEYTIDCIMNNNESFARNAE